MPSRVVPDPHAPLAGLAEPLRRPAPSLVPRIDDGTEGWPPLAGGPLDAAVPDGEGGPWPRAHRPSPTGALADLAGLSLDEYLRRVEAECIASALQVSGGNKSRAARLLGIKRSTLGDRIVRCGLQL
jgi:hypothetical protein